MRYIGTNSVPISHAWCKHLDAEHAIEAKLNLKKVGLHLRGTPLGIAAVDDVLSQATLVAGIKDKTTRQSSG